MNVYVFGNKDLASDSGALNASLRLERDFPSVAFVTVSPNEDVPFVNESHVILMDVVFGLKKPKLIEDSEAFATVLPPRFSTHDFDLNFQLKYLKKLGKIKKVTIVGLPMNLDLKKDYSSIHSIFKKLVAQDMHGS